MNGKPYREVTFISVALGILIGLLMIGSFTYASLILGFSIVGSSVAAIISWGVLRGLIPLITAGKLKGTILENNIAQTIASAINVAHSGLVFTIPALFMMSDRVTYTPREYLWTILVTAAGAVLGVLFIIPVRKQMIDIDRLRFPTGTAVAAILKAPGAGITKSILLMLGALISGAFYFLTQLKVLGCSWSLPEVIDLGKVFGLPSYIDVTFALSLLSFGAGFITGRAGLMVMAGGFLAYWIIAPIAVSAGWVPPQVPPENLAGYIHDSINKPIGIGMLIGGALAGLIMTLPTIKAAFRSLIEASKLKDTRDELPINLLYLASIIGFVLLVIGVYFLGGLKLVRILVIAFVGVIWMWFAGIIVAQVTGMTDWSPISGMSLIAVALVLYLSGMNVLVSVVMGAMVCVAISLASDMMQDLKTGFLVGAKPVRQQLVELATTWIGPVVAFGVLLLINKAYGIGTAKVPAPQASALKGIVEMIIGGNVPVAKYLLGAIIGAALSVTGIPGLGVLIGISMYLPITYILPYSLGCIVNLIVEGIKGKRWVEEWGVPFAAGLVVGEATVTLLFALYKVLQQVNIMKFL